VPEIKKLSALEMLDSRGRPTVQVTCELSSSAIASAQVPSGASTGTAEAVELRDGDPSRYRGMGCRKAVANVAGEIAAAVCDREYPDQVALDKRLIELDGTQNKSRLGANAILGVSIAFARATAVEMRIPLHEHLAAISGDRPRSLPRLTVNLFSGGLHAGGQVPIQDVLIVPVSANSIDDGLSMVYAVYQAAAEVTGERYQTRLLTADEGGLAPPFPSVEAMLDDAVTSIRRAGYVPGKDVSIAIDVAASHFFEDRRYRLGDRTLSSTEMIEQLARWAGDYPIISVEDGLAEDDWQHWPELRRELQGKALTLGDDFLCTNPERIRKAIESKACDALLLKVNQIGTLTEAADALRLARSANWQVTISARSGETEDNWLADLAAGWCADQIKVGSITQSERLAKYNRLLAIERATGFHVVSDR